MLLTISLLFSGCTKHPVSTATEQPNTSTIYTSVQSSTPSLSLTPTPIVVSGNPLPIHHLVVDGKPFQYLGATVCNQFDDKGTFGMWSKDADEDLIKSAQANGITVLQMNPPYFEGQLGVYQENELVKLDHLLDVASRNGVYICISFIQAFGLAVNLNDPYYHPGGIEGLIKDIRLKDAFKRRMAAFITRVNTINGKKYSEDPTIMAWVLCEEIVSAPENYPKGPPRVTLEEMAAWVDEMTSYIKSLDANHLITMEAASGVAKYGDNWAQVFESPNLDFLRLSDCEGRIIHLTEDDNIDFSQKVFTLGKPVVMYFTFDGSSVNQELYNKDYLWQAENLKKIFKAYYEMGVSTGFSIFYWASELNKSYMLNIEYYYAYTQTNTIICQALVDIASTLGSRNSTTIPLQFVKLPSK
ncbi:MAG: hypothetical protein JXB43_02575 [Dehalococcoidia bacterium]|nr:hypothetical protein [Dehalococcoidia bacterium]